MNDIPEDQKAYDKLVQRTQLRLLRSAMWSSDKRATWVRCYKWWRKIKDAVFDPDEPNIMLGYAFGVVEQLFSKNVEPLMKLSPPCNVLPMRLGDGAAAENFKQVARNWYRKPGPQKLIPRSKKEMAITGSRCEIDEWLNIQRKGKMWGKVEQEVEVPALDTQRQPILDKAGKPVMMRMKQMVDGEVERLIPIHYGFNTRYPSIFNIYPEPDRPTIGTGMPTDCTWAVEDMGELAIEDMFHEKYVDPKDRLLKPLYDFSRVIKAGGQKAQERYARMEREGSSVEDGYGPLIIPINPWNSHTNYGKLDKDTVYPTEATVNRSSTEDRDKVWVVRHYQADEIVTIANGKYIIQRVRNPWHVPIMPIRIECWTEDPEFIFGIGVIEAIEDELAELNDIHNLSMSQFIRIINKMLAVQSGAIESWSDFKPRAGGKIRIRGDTDVRQAIMPIEQGNVVNEMLAMESNSKGLIEFESANSDLSPGVMGTKQSHKTYKGMVEIQNNLAIRTTTIQRQALINEALRMMSMERFFSQFCFEKQPYRIYRDDGTTGLAEFNKDDVFTEGRGFEFLVEIDPNFGDTQVQRQQSLFLLDRAIDYEKLRREMRDPKMKRFDLSMQFQRVLSDFGWFDSSRVFTQDDGSMGPDEELQLLMQGGVVECRGDLVHHVRTHLLQRGAPNLKKAIEAGKADPNTIRNLELVIQQAMAKLNTFVKDPVGATEADKNSALEAMAPKAGPQ